MRAYISENKTMKTKEAVAAQLVEVLKASGLAFDDQAKAISMARAAIQPRASQQDWRAKAKPIVKPKDGGN